MKKAFWKSWTFWYSMLSTAAGAYTMWYGFALPQLDTILSGVDPDKRFAIESFMLLLNGVAVALLRKKTNQPIGLKDEAPEG